MRDIAEGHRLPLFLPHQEIATTCAFLFNSILGVLITLCIFIVVVRLLWLRGEDYDLDALFDMNVDITSQAAPSRSHIRGRLLSGVEFRQSVNESTEGRLLLVTVKGNLPLLAGFHFGPEFDATFDIPDGVDEIRIGVNRALLWKRGDALHRFRDRYGVWRSKD